MTDRLYSFCHTIFNVSVQILRKSILIHMLFLTVSETPVDCSFYNSICDYVASNTSTDFVFSYVFNIESLGEFILYSVCLV